MAFYQFSESDVWTAVRHIGADTKQIGNELRFKYCPYCHGGKNKDKGTFSISLENGGFNCKRSSCGVNGGMVKLAQDFGFSLGRDNDAYYKRDKKFRDFKGYPKPETKDPAVRYMLSRGIS